MASNSITIFYYQDKDKSIEDIEWNLFGIPTELMPHLANAIIREHLERKKIPNDYRDARQQHGIVAHDLFNQS